MRYNRKMRCKICRKRPTTYIKGLFDNRYGSPGKYNILKCPGCGFMQTSPQLKSKEISDLYTNYYPKRDADIHAIVTEAKHIPNKKEIYQKGLTNVCHFQTKKGQKVLDIGCGTCQSLLEIRKLGGEAWGLDPDRNSLSVAKKLKLKFHCGTIYSCNFPRKYFDLITATQVLEHEINPLRFLKECKKYLKPGGKIILSFPNTDSFYRKFFGRKWIHWHVPYHLNHFGKKSLIKLIQKSKYKLSSISTITPNLWTVLQVRSLITKNKIGKKNLAWVTSINKTRGKNNFMRRLVYSVFYINNELLIINRLIDKLGFGESFIVTLST